MAVMVANDERTDAPYDPQAIQEIDWKRFRGQKRFLCRLLEDYRASGNMGHRKQIGQLTGVLNLMDSLQDYSVEMGLCSYEEVWGL